MLTARSVGRLLAAARTNSLAQPQARADRRVLLSAIGVQAYHQSSGSEPAAGRRGGVRPSKTAAKQEAKHFQEMSRQLSQLTEKQLARLEPLVGEEVVTAVGLAARISHRNQGRQRQEGLVARLLRESLVEEAEVAQLQAAIESVKAGQGVIANPAVEQLQALWMDALLAGEAQATTEVFGLAQAQGVDLQQVRQLLRQAQQTEPIPTPAAADSAVAEGQEDSEAAAQPATPPNTGSSSSCSLAAVRLTAKARSARKQLRKLLQQLAEAQLAAGIDEEE